MTRRLIAACLLALALPAAADVVDESLEIVVQRDGYESRRAEAHRLCANASPAIAALLNDRSISNFCVVRFNAPRFNALLMGIQLSIALDNAGRTAAADAVEVLIKPLEATGRERPVKFATPAAGKS